MRRSAWLWLGLFSGMTFISTSCHLGSGSGGGSSADAQVRLLLASPDAPQIKLLVDAKQVAGNLNYGNATAYQSLKPGAHHIQAVPVSGGAPVFDQSVSFAASVTQTLLLSGPAAGIQAITLTDGGTTSVVGSGYVRVVNASATMGPADVYIVPAGTGVGGVSPIKAGLAFNQNTGYRVLVAGDYQVFMMTPNTVNALLNTGSISLPAAQNQTLIVLDGNSGGFQYALLTDQ